MVDFDKMTKNFILNEGQGPSVNSYIHSLEEILKSMTPRTVSDHRKLEIAQENIRNVRRHVRHLEEKVNFLEEEVRVIQEEKRLSEGEHDDG